MTVPPEKCSRFCAKCKQVRHLYHFPFIHPRNTNCLDRHRYCRECLERALSEIRHDKKMQQRDHSEEAMQRRARTVINAAQRRTRRLQAMPAWADKKEIRRFYDLAQQRSKETGTLHHVDHIIPLIHPLVCGLHVPANLRVVPFRVNLRKSNKFHMEN